MQKLASSKRRKRQNQNLFQRLRNDRKSLREMIYNPPPLLIPAPPSSCVNTNCLKTKKRFYTCDVQALRSVSAWSLNCADRKLMKENKKRVSIEDSNDPSLENSILRAYINVIENSRHYIYIENQYFISSVAPDYYNEHVELPGEIVRNGLENLSSRSASKVRNQSILCLPSSFAVRNLVGDAIYRRILRAHKEGNKFRVYIIIPALCAVEGEIGTTTGLGQQIIMHYHRASLFEGPHALIARLKKHIENPLDYVSVNMLRKWESWPDGRLMHEMVYVHNKLMIVDDCKVILGSANINDRSLLGSRDSELAMLIEDIFENDLNDSKSQTHHKIETKFDGIPVIVGKFARRFRRILMAEHLGVLTKQDRNNCKWDLDLLNDPVCDRFFHDVWNATASRNSRIMEEVFLAIPSSRIKTFQYLSERRHQISMSRSNPDEARLKLKDHKGQLEMFPSEFLCQENLMPSALSKEGIVPATTWT